MQTGASSHKEDIALLYKVEHGEHSFYYTLKFKGMFAEFINQVLLTRVLAYMLQSLPTFQKMWSRYDCITF
jgi:hypothetical protein